MLADRATGTRGAGTNSVMKVTWVQRRRLWDAPVWLLRFLGWVYLVHAGLGIFVWWFERWGLELLKLPRPVNTPSAFAPVLVSVGSAVGGIRLWRWAAWSRVRQREAAGACGACGYLRAGLAAEARC